MNIVLEVSTTRYDEQIEKIRLAMNNLAALCRINDAFVISNPTSKFGWTFFKIVLKSYLYSEIQVKFSDMFQKYNIKKPEEKFLKFISDFFESRGCTVNLKLVNS